jgi:ABC-2 type transport system ATP-binding protein
MTTAVAAIEARGLSKKFGDLAAVDDLNLRVERGEIFGLVGPDGAGKTTTMRMLVGAIEPSAGTAFIAGFDVQRQPGEVQGRIGYLSQQFSLYGDLTVAENMAFFADLHGVPRRERREREQEALRFSRLEPFARRLAADLSGGMRQKLALACSLMHDPEVLLLDEPTTGVDPVSRREFWALLQRLVGRGVTLLLTTPYMDEAERCRRVGFLHKGRLLVSDAPGNLRRLMEGEMLALRCAVQRRAKEVVEQVPGVRNVQVFGDRLHIWVTDAATTGSTLTAALREAGIGPCEVQTLAPELEDVFFSLVSA